MINKVKYTLDIPPLIRTKRVKDSKYNPHINLNDLNIRINLSDKPMKMIPSNYCRSPQSS